MVVTALGANAQSCQWTQGEVINRINGLRASWGRAGLYHHGGVSPSAQYNSWIMAQNNSFTGHFHVPGGQSQNVYGGYDTLLEYWNGAAPVVIARYGYASDPAAAASWWTGSYGHLMNYMNPVWRGTGVGCEERNYYGGWFVMGNAYYRYRYQYRYYTQNFLP